MKLEIPLRLPSVANLRLHWAAKAALVKKQRNAVRLAMLTCHEARDWFGMFYVHDPADPRDRCDCPLPIAVITLTRIGPKKLDSDNVASAFKAVRDEVADELGVDDGDPRIRWDYAQERGPYGIRIEVKPA